MSLGTKMRGVEFGARSVIAVVVVALLSLGVMAWANEHWSWSHARFLPVTDKLKLAREEATAAYLAGNRQLAGETVVAAEALGSVGRARRAVEDLAAGQSPLLRLAGRADDGALANELARYTAALDSLQRALQEVFAPTGEARTSRARLNEAFSAADVIARGIDGRVVMVLEEATSAQRREQRIGLALWLCFVSLAVGVLLRSSAREREQTRQRRLLTEIIESATDAFFVKDAAGRYLQCNRAAARLAGKSVEEILQRRDTDLFPPETAAEILRHDREVLDRGEAVASEIHVTDTAGNARVFSYARAPIFDAKGNVAGLYGISRDITEMRRAEERQRRSAMLASELQILRALLDSARAGYWDWHVAAGTETFSSTFIRMLGYEEEQFKPCPESWRALIFAEDLEEAGARYAEHVETHGREPYYMEARFRHRDGSTVWVIRSGLVVEWSDDGQPLRMVGAHIDVTALRRREEELAVARAHAEAANAAKSEFLANMSHEIRTPLNAILGLAHMLSREALSEPAREKIEKINGAGRSLLAIINGILDFSKIEARHVEIECNAFRLSTVLNDVITLIADVAADRPIAVSLEPLPAGVDCVLGDAVRLRQVLLNLGVNAVKFTERGAVNLRVEVETAEVGTRRLRFTIADTGIGIAQDKIGDIFAPFVQADSSMSRRFGGTGLGLAISRRLVELMGGELGVESTPGQGSVFHFSLPFAVCMESRGAACDPRAATASRAGAGPSLAGLRVLLVDDNELNREVARHILQGAGASVIEAENGAIAVDMLEGRGALCDVVLMDIQMPVMDGYEATRRIRRIPGLETLRVMALSAGVFDAERKAALEAGMNAFIPKPLVPEDLIAQLRTVCAAGGTVAPDERPIALPPPVRERVRKPAVMDVARGVESWKNEANYRNYLQRFLETYGGEDEVLASHLAAGEDDKAIFIAHRLRGAAGAMALPLVGELAERIETALRAGRDAGDAFEELRGALTVTRAQIGAYLGGKDDPALDHDARVAAPCAVDGRDLDALAQALNTDDPSQVEPVLASMDQRLPAHTLAALRRCVAEFDFRAAEACVDELRKAARG